MKAVIMAGGFGTRLRPLTMNIPKPMVPVINRPIMEHVVELLKSAGFKELIVLLYFQPEAIQNYFGDGEKWGVKIQYIKPEADFGTAGSVKRAQPHLDDTFLVISADVLTDFDLQSALRFHEEKSSSATILLTRVKDPRAYGIVITEESGRIHSFLEKPTWGEVFSDTVNTGIYVLEPEVLEKIPPDLPFDFSKDLFPALLKEGVPLYGMITPGYWRDIGNLEDYRQAHMDILHGEVNIKVEGTRVNRVGMDIWVGKGVKIHPRAKLRGTVILGDGSQVGDDAYLHDSVIGPRTIISDGSQISDSVIWSDCEIGKEVRIKKAVLGFGVKVGPLASIQEGSVIADGCLIGNKATVSSGVRIWPFKHVEGGAFLTGSLIWGDRWSRSLFGNYGITGLANQEITPEFAAKVGAAYGTLLKKGQSIISSYDGHRACRLIHRSLMAGLLSTGINIFDLGQVAIPVARHATVSLEALGGVHVRKSPFNPKVIDIKFFDETGLDLPPTRERAIENSYFREEFLRVSPEEVGMISFPSRILEYYQESFLHALNLDVLREARFKVVVDYGFGTASTVLPILFGKMGVEVVALNAYLDERKITKSEEEYREALQALAEIVVSLKCQVGFMLDAGAEKLFMVDDQGKILSGDESLACLAYLVLKAKPGGKIAVPITASSALEEIADSQGGRVVYTRTSSSAMMLEAKKKDITFVGEVKNGYIFPEFQPFTDGMFALAKTLELLALEGTSLREVFSAIKPRAMVREHLACPWEMKGTIIRRLLEENPRERVMALDGVKIFFDRSWVLVLPDKDRPLLHVNAEADSEEVARRLVELYLNEIRSWMGVK
ncbi:MAG: mannose-1-phosphate guanyltransferase [Caldiserica bacterium]|jgi:mannose-1-phosphate guanylyltransferase/phosphomannomutase|nr:mannose-1-phosphate guanyltransferase [Caldisericota bacterium]MDH7562170.1 mannose-1-phosphate guanyltransferase [Caldisericota bacterium]